MTAPAKARPEVTDNLKKAAEQEGLFEMEVVHPGVLKLSERFILPPFSILDARQGAWQDRKRNWLSLGLRSEDGRDARMLAKSVSNEWVEDASVEGGGYYKGAEPGTVNAKILALTNGQSIFDPVLCELFYRWFCPPGGRILDPYAGGSVRGLVAAHTGRVYDGIDLSARQIEANEKQAASWSEQDLFDPEFYPTWHNADSWAALAPGASVADDGPYDFVWSCPPYHDLEVYSDHPDDQSNMPWDEFAKRYTETIEGAVDRLADDRFAAFVIGEIREGSNPGFYRDFMGLTIRAFEMAGAGYYNECILVTSVGTLPLRTAKQFMVSRKVGKTHQTVLVFCKGDPRRAAQACHEKSIIEDATGHALDALADVEEVEGVDDLTGGAK